MAGPWEVEQKFHVTDIEMLLERLADLKATEVRTELHVDTYLAHPCRDFRASDEAFRIRQFNSEACVTYKGKRLPGAVKTRPEIELAIQHADIPSWLEMMKHLGFTPKPEVRKSRRIFTVAAPADWVPARSAPFTVALDNVAQLGDFAEIELLVDDQAALDAARRYIEQMASLLGLVEVQPRSYLSMLLTKLGVE